ncbi:non-ribosomal peptide synthase/polyketide synthase [Paenibacillus sp. MER TA 81-3]|uniref:non-ribosomal peptide synthetase n=1 Tax=Paenibacillus sp. MER TA 81-3 TaxID=2939573 RepID=UPI00203D7436|nr:non-ribosomal peptide synthetase [Paenibacillus sp. MER TA 81-3]MCM3338069.1 non-ribosomal peptide synthase/polyketide synthase [Paenibacillus sp. MER TA 81-3]
MSDINTRLASLTPEQRQLLVKKLTERKTASRPSPTPQPIDPGGSVLSFAQQRLWLLDQLESGTSHYNIPFSLRFRSKLHISALQHSLTEIVRRHQALRTRFEERASGAVQLVDPIEPNWQFPLVQTDLSSVSAVGLDKEADALRLVNEEAARPFNLATGPLLRGLLVTVGEDDHILLVTFHHIVFDGWSLTVFQQELLLLYEVYAAGQSSPLPDLPIQYVDYAIWQRKWLTETELQHQLDYWTDKLGDADHVLELPTDRPRPAVQMFHGDIRSLHIGEDVVRTLRELSRKEGASLFMAMLAAFQTFLYRHTGKHDLSVGTPIANRGMSEVEGLIGFFVNTLVMRSDLSGNLTYRQLLKQVRKTALEAYSNQDLSFERLVDALQPERSVSHAPLFQVMFTMDEAQVTDRSGTETDGLRVEPYTFESRSAKFDITLMIFDTGSSGVVAQMEYNTDLFHASTVERMLRHLNNLLAGIAANPDSPIGTLPMLDEAEVYELLVARNQTTVASDASLTCLHERIAVHAEQTPDTIAIVDGQIILTYRELNTRANRLAHYLRKLGVGPETIVGVLAHRSAAQITTLVAIMKAGGAYLPIDPNYPRERIAFMLEDARIPVLLTERTLQAHLPQSDATVVWIEDTAAYAQEEGQVPPASPTSPDQLAYVIYTSGSTGKPKGVQIEHFGLLNLVQWHITEYAMTAADRTTLFAGPAFDASVWELWPTLAAGASIYIPHEELRTDPVRLREWIVQSGITLSFLPTPMAEAIISLDWSLSCSLRYLLTGGDRLRFFPADNLPFHLVNHYGPTEATVVAIAGHVPTVSANGGQLHLPAIGRPIANTEVYLLDEHMQLVPDGVAGEIYVGGSGLARGYLHQPELTTDKFVPSPFPSGRLLYRTGDLARYVADGFIEFIGRADDQVKVRGYRIELGEVEKAIADHPAVKEAVALVKEVRRGDRRLVAYVVPDERDASSSFTAELRAYLRAKLPEYMVPAAFVMLDQLPVTPNGKVDRKALPEAEFATETQAYVAPRTAKETLLSAVWAEVLGVERVGIHDNFFELGGDSILSIQIVSRARQSGLQLTPKLLFQHQTIADLAPEIREGALVEADQGIVTGDVPLTPIQRWFFAQPMQSPHHFNQSMMFTVHPSVDAQMLREAVRHLIAHHDGLRLQFTAGDTGWEQYNADIAEEVPFTCIDVSGLSAEEQVATIERTAAQAQQGLSLNAGVLLQAVYFELGADQAGRLLIVIHHLGVDGVSWRILMEDLYRIGKSLAEGEPITLPEKTTAFRNWAKKLAEYASTGKMLNEIDYWLDEKRKYVPALPADFVQGENTNASTQDVLVELAPDETHMLLQDVPHAYRTHINDVLLTALLLAMSAWSGHDKLLLHMEGHGREDLFDEVDLSRTVGWFTSMYPVLLERSGNEINFGAELKSVKEQLRQVPNNGIGYGLLRYMSSNEHAQMLEALPKPQVSFNYLGQFDQVLNSGEEGLFGQAPERAGPEQSLQEKRAHLIDITGLVAGGSLRLTWTYSKNLYMRERVERLASLYMEQLRAIIAHCRLPEARGVTPSDFPLARITQEQLDRLAGTGHGVEDIYTLSPMQQGMLFHAAYSPDSHAYFEQMSWTLQGDFHPAAMERAWNQVVERHSILRTAFYWEELNESHQVVYRHVTVPVAYLDWRAYTESERETMTEAFLREDRVRGFELSEAPLMRITMIRLTEESHLFLWSYHHLLLDGWSMNALIAEVLQVYETVVRSQDKPVDIPFEPIRPYRDYIGWLQQQDMERAKQYWRDALRGFHAPTPLTVDRLLPAGSEAQGEYSSTKITLPVSLNEKIRAFTRQHQVTSNTLVQSAWALLLRRYSGEEDVVFGATVSGRPADLVGVESMMGIFINTLPVRIRVPDDETILTWVQDVQAKQVEQREYEYSPLSMIQSCSELSQGTPLFDSLFVFENYPVSAGSNEDGDTGGLTVSSMYLFEQTNYPLTLLAVPDNGFDLVITYDQQRFEAGAITRMLNHLVVLLEGICSYPEQTVRSLTMLTEEERQLLLTKWNRTDINYPLEQCIHHLFEQQVERTPELPALIFEDRVLTYAELNAEANRLARYLQQRGVGPEVPVAVCMERSIDMVVGLLAILKAGGAYVPMDPDYPHDRLTFMFEDTNAPLLLTQRHLIERIPEYSGQAVCLDEQRQDIASESDAQLDIEISPDSMCYIIYTSGSTGRPKGVVNIHRAVVNRLIWMQAAYQLTSADRVLQKTPFSFDVSVWEFFWPIMTGATLVVAAPGGHRDPAYLRDIIRKERITTLHFVPSMLQAFLEEEGIEHCSTIRQVMCSGEALSYDYQERFFAKLDAQLHNLYGPTEAAIDVTHWTCRRDTALRTVPIGVPISNIHIYLLDQELRPVPIGVPGELHIGGVGLARDYWNRGELTKERFIRNPFDPSMQSRLYKTGDLARYMPDGVIEYMGRIDHQVKIRGFRIELGEIESVLASHPHIKEAAVVTREDTPGHKRLVSYVVADESEPMQAAQLSSYLIKILPEYMVPASYTFLKAMPLSPNGKLDRKALPAPQDARLASDKPYAPPRNAVERTLAHVWADVLSVKQVSIHDNYFELGGDSILSMQIVSRARLAGVHLTPKLVFENPTIAQLAAVAKEKVVVAEQGEVAGEVILTPIQRWFFDKDMVDRHHWNQSMLLSVRPPVNRQALEQAIAYLLKQHDALRLRFIPEDDGWQQVSAPVGSDMPLAWIDLSNCSEESRRAAIQEETARLQCSLDLAHGPLMRAALFDYGESDAARLFIVIHHLAVDAVSWRIVMEDLETAYVQLLHNVPVQLQLKTTSYRQFAARLAEYAQSEAVKSEHHYWTSHVDSTELYMPFLEQFSTVEDALKLNTVASTRTVSVSLSAEDTTALLQEVPLAYRTQINDVLLTALLIAFHQWAGHRTLQVDMEGHGREDIFEEFDLSRTVGWFTSIFPVRLEASPESVESTLKRVKELVRNIPQRGIGYGLLRYVCEDDEIHRLMSSLPKSLIMFNYLGQVDQGAVADTVLASAHEDTALDSSPNGLRRYLLDIAGMITNGEFHLGFMYSEHLFRAEAIAQLSELFLSALRAIISHCRQPEAGGITPSDFPLAKLPQVQLDQLYVKDRNIRDLYPLTPMQAGMLFHSLAEPHSGMYCEQSAFTLQGTFDAQAFTRAWHQVMERHAVLRTRIEWEGLDHPVQVLVDEVLSVPFHELDWTMLSANEQECKLQLFLEEDRQIGFDFTQAPIMRFTIIHYDANTVKFVWTFHHLLLDGWSNPIVIQECFALYESILTGADIQLEPVRSYRDYMYWLNEQDQASAESFWKTYLAGIEAPTPLPLTRPAAAEPSGFAEVALHVDEVLTASLNSLARTHQLTLSTIVQGAWGLLLGRYSGESDVLFGATVAGRPADLEGVETIVGLFINTLPVRTTIPANVDVISWLQELQSGQTDKQQYEYAALSQIQSWSDVPQGMPLFDSIIVYENYPIQVTVSEPGEVVEKAAGEAVNEVGNEAGNGSGDVKGKQEANGTNATGGVELLGVQSFERTNYPITLSVLPGDVMELQIGYDTARFTSADIARMLGHLRNLLQGIVADPNGLVVEVPMLGEADTAQLLVDWNETAVEYPSGCVHQLIEAQALSAPDRTALVVGADSLTYRELNERANRLAHYLRKLGAGPEVLVGICAERSVELAVGILGILKSGAAYVPIDAAYPADRIAYMVEDARMLLLLTQERLIQRLPAHEATIVLLDADWSAIAEQSADTVMSGVSEENASYVIYTSGSTGQPKGVVVTHAAMLNHNSSAVALYELTEADRVLQFATISFDAAIEELFPTWLCGAALVMPEERLLSISGFTELIEREQLSVLNLPTAYWHEWVSELANDRVSLPNSIRAVIIGGERPSPERFAEWQRLAGERTAWYNTYGPTETTVISTAFRAPRPDGNGGPTYSEVPIGRPIANTQVYILDSHLQPVPTGIPGELYIGGRGLARGYLNKPELSEAVFIPNPFAASERLYRTGDRARYLAHGEIEYLGRTDYQVKIRGFRIELEEVESALVRLDGVRHALALAREDQQGDKRLVAYAVVEEGVAVSAVELQQALKEQLPGYMIPSAIVLLDQLPLTANGKLDRRALPAPDLNVWQKSREYTAPRNDTELILSQVWAQVLGIERVGVHDNFFELGGDSILSIQIVSRTGQAGLKLTPKQLFENQTIAELAAVAKQAVPMLVDEGPVTGPVPLTPIQHWFFEQPMTNRHHWNQAMLLTIKQPVHPEALQQAMAHLIRHHDVLRLRFMQTEAGWEQGVADVEGESAAPVLVINLAKLSEQEQVEQIEAESERLQQSLNLTEGPIIRTALFDLGTERPARLLIVIHHLAVDGVSWRIILEDLQLAYEQLGQSLPVQLPPKTTSFKAWSERLHIYADSHQVRNERAYWLKAERLYAKPLPTDIVVLEEDYALVNTYASSDTITTVLDAEMTRALLQEVPPVYRTRINDILLTALARTIAPWTDSRTIVVDVEEHGREDLFEDVDLSRTVGWFTAVHPLLLELSVSGTVQEDIKAIKEQLRSIPQKGIRYGLLRYLSTDKEVSDMMRHATAPGILFNYMGQMDQATEETGATIGTAPESYGMPVSPEAPRDHLIEINGIISGKQLVMNWTYSSELHRTATIERLAASYMDALREVIVHCRQPEAGGWTASDFPLVPANQAQLDRLYASERRIRDLYPLSPMQEGMLFHSLAEPHSGMYCEQTGFTLAGKFSLEAFEQAWRRLLERHSILRTRVCLDGFEQPIQAVLDEVPLPIDQLDWRSLSAEQQERMLESFLKEDRHRGFQFHEAPIMRFTLIQLANDKVQFIWTFHHMLLDGWSNPIVIQEYFALYYAFTTGTAIQLEPTRFYREYIAWLHKQDQQAAESFWRGYLAGIEAPTEMRLQRPVIASASDYAELELEVGTELTSQLQSFARSHQLTLSTMVQAAWSLLLSRYSGESDVLFGATVAGRPADLAGVESIVGLFINTLPVRVQVRTDMDVVKWLSQLQQQQAEKQQYEYAALTQIQSWSEVPHGTPLFDSIIVYENYPIQVTVPEAAAAVDEVTASEGVELLGVHSFERTNYPITLSVLPGGTLGLHIGYDTTRFSAADVRRMLEHLRNLLQGMVADPTRMTVHIPMLGDAETAQLLVDWNETAVEYPPGCVHQLIEAQALSTPDRTALVVGADALTYRELNERANRLAHYLRKLGAGPEVLVGICAERSVELAVGILGILKSGAAYVPIDAAYPADRIAYMLEDARMPLLLTQERLIPRLPVHEATIVLLDTDWNAIAEQSADTVMSGVSEKNAAYVIYTSGSTGQPKGVVVTHAAMLNHNSSAVALYELTEADRVLQFATISFDAAIEELFPTWLCGAALVMPEERLLSISGFTELIEREQLSVLNLPTAYWHEWVSELATDLANDRVSLPNSIRAVIIGGERPSPERFAEWQQLAGERIAWYNTYGPTETTVISTAFRAPRPDGSGGPTYREVPIGWPIANTQVYILDAHLQPVPTGIPGELYIGGRGLARGYLNKPELSEAVFIPNPFAAGERLYRTGDRARYLANGEIEYLGRTDYQVKIRGFRIELEEVESALVRQDGVRHALVLAREDEAGEQRLIAYVVFEEEAEVSAANLQQALRDRLPAYMIPSVIVLLDQLPLTANGKVDRKALPVPAGDLNQGNAVPDAPRNLTEFQLKQIFEDMLQVSDVGIHDNFFNLGGHSLLAIRMIARIRQVFSCELPISIVLEKGTIAELAKAILYSGTQAPFSPLVTLQPNGTQAPLFYVHPAGGLVLSYTTLSKHLGSDQPFYAFQSRALNGEKTGFIEEMAADYITELRSAHPHGPYRLGGWSIGGTIAFEMARQLVQQGEEVANLVVLDTPAEYVVEDEDMALSDAELWSKLIDLPLDELKQVEPDRQLDELLAEAKKRGIAAEDMTVEHVRSLVQVYRDNSAVTNAYNPGMYSGRLTLIRVNDDSAVYQEETMGWSELAKGGVDVYYVSGEHHTMMDSPHVEVVAQHMLHSFIR